MSTERNKAILRRFFDEAWNRKNPDIADELFAPEYILSDPGNLWIATGPAGVRQMIQTYNAAFPDARFTIEEQIAEDDWVVTRWKVESTHRGALLDLAATDRRSGTAGILFSELKEGKIVREWTQWNKDGLLSQLGAGEAVR